MSCRFRFIDGLTDAVVLRLYRDAQGYSRGNISGPIIGDHNGKPMPYVDRCILSTDLAHFAAIRIANETDSEVVVTGDATLWNPLWGELVFGETRPLVTTNVAAYQQLDHNRGTISG